MIRPEDVRKHLDKRPFEAFRICLTDGQAYDVRHPDLCLIDRSTVYVGVPDPKLRGCVKRVDYCPYDYSAFIEPLDRKRRRMHASGAG